jgi:hypothetical protein
MTVFRLISLPAHGAIEYALGVAVMVAALALGLDGPGTVVCFAFGAILAGVALAAADRGVSPSVHSSFDLTLVTITLVAAAALAIAGGAKAAVLLAFAALAQLLLASVTRYSARS